ncbi:MAG: hypothetical protein ACD_40C00133G0001 [uncultured bacterium]|jgi:hypothetical protein|uniref:Uncharacterized protein n=2 Tax=Candidatus Collieribacteriota TaxID=1752725 RepID=A0A1F5FXT3_9BACT|nr:MAG: hypothetical protein ACD_40C00133G0001 [uncultured bacterium]KKU21146.1 MAG: hypothetical protein UX32_C0006G0006 [Microgenomates group bacterium GW2011_GWF1_46_12]KKU27062.1 MAG: hypothetical protein UX38_C0001G0062 [Microgenomates group bacterium GW2011_GWC1_46_16]KKU27896.1 MAG: hypothetical protein UX40_C0005G0049 [Microgenomates group bacterium GW2011_GWF2_46_18]KKU44298.1 MAG: hypothetical protein UX59_C0001G0017 [Microgenomates group bacterium GW2011_GWA1_46_7]KKU44956.1 MAG: hy
MDPIGILQSITLLGVVKVMMGILLLVYAIFALLMMRQIAAMTRAVAMKDDLVIRMMGVFHFGFAIVVLVMAVIFL